MKKALLVLITAALATPAAKGDDLGLQIGWPSGFGVHYAISNVFGVGNDLRFSLSMPVFYGFRDFALELNIDAMFARVRLAKDFSLYAGVNAEFGAAFSKSTTFVIGGYGLVGLKYSFSPAFSTYLDAKLGYVIAGFNGGPTIGSPMVGANLGFNFSF